MKYDFDTPVNRRGTYSLKWDVDDGELPMWVADMDFKVAPEIQKAVMERAGHGVFGYSIVPDNWARAYSDWWQKRHGFKINEEWLVFCTGVVPAISSIVRKLTTPAEKVLIQTPVYNIFFNSILNNGRQALECPLEYDGAENGYHIDFTKLEEKLSDPQTTLMLLCNPQNPAGIVWDKPTLERIGELCFRHGVTVVADEIHCDLTDPGVEYIPFASVSDICREISITCVAPTKTFNIAGLQTAAVIIPQKNLRHKVWRSLNTDEVAEPNVFAAVAAAAAYEYGAEWLDGLRNYIYENKLAVREFLEKEHLPIKLVPSNATYLLWLDCSEVLLCRFAEDTIVSPGGIARFIRERSGLYLSAGEQFGGNGSSFVRMNIACPRAVLNDGLLRLKKALKNI